MSERKQSWTIIEEMFPEGALVPKQMKYSAKYDGNKQVVWRPEREI